jgi:hypothetical protein
VGSVRLVAGGAVGAGRPVEREIRISTPAGDINAREEMRQHDPELDEPIADVLRAQPMCRDCY